MAVDGLDLVFLALPHGESQKLVPELDGRVGRIVDLAADFRLKDADLYPTWYGEAHTCPERLADFAYGLPELFRPRHPHLEHGRRARLLRDRRRARAHAARAGRARSRRPASWSTPRAACRAPGGRRSRTPPSARSTRTSAPTALLTHRHTPGDGAGDRRPARLHAAPRPDEPGHPRHLLRPAGRRARSPPATRSDVVRAAYAGEPFVVVRDGPLSTKATQGSNTAHVSVVVDPRTGWLIACAALDNLVKGAAGQAVQCANLLLGLPETTGLADRRAVPVSVTAAQGFVAAGHPLRREGERRPRPLAGGHRRRASRSPRRPCSPPTR